MLLQLQAQPFNINIVQVYAPTADKNDDVIEEFYAQIETVLRSLKKHEINIVMGDFNAKVGQGKVEGYVGDYGLGERNDRGDRLVQFCQEKDFIVSNTMFQLPPRRLYTWKSPADKTDHIVRNQIDYVLISRRHRNTVKSLKTYPGTDIGSDHNPLVAKLCIKLKKLCHPTPKPKMDTSKIRDREVRVRLHLGTNNEICRLKSSDPDYQNVENTWMDFKNAIVQTGKSVLSPTPIIQKKDWMTTEILQLISTRREYKGKDHQKYKCIQNTIRRKIRVAKETW